MSIEKEVAHQNILAAQAQWEGLFHCPVLAVDNEQSKAIVAFDKGLKGRSLLQEVRSNRYGKK